MSLDLQMKALLCGSKKKRTERIYQAGGLKVDWSLICVIATRMNGLSNFNSLKSWHFYYSCTYKKNNLWRSKAGVHILVGKWDAEVSLPVTACVGASVTVLSSWWVKSPWSFLKKYEVKCMYTGCIRLTSQISTGPQSLHEIRSNLKETRLWSNKPLASSVGNQACRVWGHGLSANCETDANSCCGKDLLS